MENRLQLLLQVKQEIGVSIRASQLDFQVENLCPSALT